MWHIIEWIRTTILLTVIFIGVNMMHVWYATALSSLYGIASFIYVHYAAFSADGQQCSTVQNTRYTWLVLEVIFFWVFFFVFQFPMAVLFLYKKEKLQECLD